MRTAKTISITLGLAAGPDASPLLPPDLLTKAQELASRESTAP
jgi:hypothetical protein